MYNSDQKTRYLNNCRFESTTVELIERIFNATQMEEEQFGKDIVEFNQIEVTDLLKSFNSKSPRRLKTNCFYFNDYYLWCRKEDLVNNIMNPFDKDIIDAIIDNVIPVKQLYDKFFNKEDLLQIYLPNVIDVSNKFIAYALFCGIKGEGYVELVNLKMSDLNYGDKTIKLITGRIVKVDDLFINLMINTNDQTQYFADGIEKESNFNSYDYVKTEYIIKTCSSRLNSDVVNAAYINKRIKVIKDQSENSFVSATTLYKNGLISYIKEKYAEQNINLKTALFNEINKKLYTYDKQTQKYIDEFGHKMTVRMLRMELKDYIDVL